MKVAFAGSPTPAVGPGPLGDDQVPENAFDKDPGAAAEPAQPGESAQPEATPIQPIATAAVQSR